MTNLDFAFSADVAFSFLNHFFQFRIVSRFDLAIRSLSELLYTFGPEPYIAEVSKEDFQPP